MLVSGSACAYNNYVSIATYRYSIQTTYSMNFKNLQRD